MIPRQEQGTSTYLLENGKATEFAAALKFVEGFVNNPLNRIPLASVSNIEDTCGDGRTSRQVGQERLRRQFGGSMGDYTAGVATLRSLATAYGISLPRTFQKKVLHTVVGVIGKDHFYLHTDDHEGHDISEELKRQGVVPYDMEYDVPRCGDHVTKLQSYADYGLYAADMRPQVQATRPHGLLFDLYHDVLQGIHKERALVLLESPEVSIQTQDQEGNQLFVLTQTLNRARNWAMTDALMQEFNNFGIDKEIFDATYTQTKDDHHLLTAHKLAPGAPIFGVNIPGLYEPAKVELLGIT